MPTSAARISVRVDYVDGHGTAETLTSAETLAIANVNNAPTGLPVIAGNAVEDGVLSVDTSAIADADGLGAFGYQWLRDGAAIAGATGSELLLGRRRCRRADQRDRRLRRRPRHGRDR